jgi:cytochrome oxidase Cu insertion factor (SCO1/SenC/PrrC family)
VRLKLPQRRLLIWYYCGIAVAVILVGTFAVHLWIGDARAQQGTALLMASAKSADSLSVDGAAIHSSSGWHDLTGSFTGKVAKAPDTTTLARARVDPGDYDALRVGGQVVPTSITVRGNQVVPILVAVADGRPEQGGVYAGSDQFNIGLNELSGQMVRMPDYQLVDQNGRPFTSAGNSGQTLVLAAFHTDCQETCPIYTGMFLDLARKLPPSVKLVEATTEPDVDTPSVLAGYASSVGANWTFATGSRTQMEEFWRPLGVQLSGEQLHTSTLAVIDGHGYIRSVYRGVPDVGGKLPEVLRKAQDPTGARELQTHGDGWGTTQVLDSLSAVAKVAPQPSGAGQAAPPFSSTDLSGRPISLSQFKGHPVVVNFWASWCSACRDEMPRIQQAAKANPELRVVLIDVRDNHDAARRFLSELGVKLPVATDPGGSIGASYMVTGLPTTVFVRSDGTIASRYPGAMDEKTLGQHLSGLGLN